MQRLRTVTLLDVTTVAGHHAMPAALLFIFSSGGHLVYRCGTVLAILLGSHRGNITMKFESHWPKGSGGVSF